MYISKRDYGGECLSMGVDEGTDLSNFGIGKQVRVEAIGTVKSVRAPYIGTDYDKPWDYESNKGKDRPTKVHPGTVEIDLEGKPTMSDAPGKPSGIADLTAMLDSDDYIGD
jgi:hypothetical protein